MKSIFRVTIFQVLFFVLLSIGISSEAMGYCYATGGCEEYIYGVSVGSIYTWATPCYGYSDYTGTQSAVMEFGQSYVFEVVTAVDGNPYYGYTSDQCAIWIDWNQDGDFYDTDELCYSVQDYGYFSGLINVPDSAVGGTTRMRVRLIDANYNYMEPCGSSYFGEVEDYTIIIPDNRISISGYKFDDQNGNGAWDSGEPNLPGWEIYIDENSDGVYQSTEPNVITDPNGMYFFENLDSPATYTIREVAKDGWTQTLPGVPDYEYVIETEPNNVYSGYDFGNTLGSGSAVVLTAIEDTYIKEESPDTNYGDATGIACGLSSAGALRSYVKFDLSSIPVGQRIVSATLQLHCSFWTGPAPVVEVYLASNSWDEMTATWNDPPYVATYYPYNIPLDQTTVTIDLNTWDVTDTADSQYVLNGMVSFQLRTDETIVTQCGFYSKEGYLPDAVPKLVVQYEPAFGGGTGTPDDPFQIWTAEQMNAVGQSSARWDKHYILMDDISMADYTGSNYNQIGIWSSSVSQRSAFTGVFDGNGHTISDFQASELFGYLSGAQIQRLGMIAPQVSGSGALVYRAEFTDIAECWVQGGQVQDSSIVGGLVGYAQLSNLSGCGSSAQVTASGDDVGGLVGYAYGLNRIQNCFSTGDVSGQNYVGGFVGESFDSVMVNCYSAGAVTGTGTEVGGFCGFNEVGFLPDAPSSLNCFWDVQTSNQTESALGTGMPTAEMKNLSMFLAAGWDFVDETANGRNEDWAIPDGGGYPVLWYQLPTAPSLPTFAGGDGSQADPYQIETVDQFNSIGHRSVLMDQQFKLMNDLDFAGQTFVPIADGPHMFMGTLDGNGQTLENIAVSIPEYHCNMGVIGNLYTGRVMNVTLKNTVFAAEYAQTLGSLAGKNRSGKIENCSSIQTDVTGQWSVGGLVGVNTRYAEISNCVVSGRVEAVNIVSIIGFGAGGLVGENSWWSVIEAGGAWVDVTGDELYLGGLVGNAILGGQFTDCYARGTVTLTGEMSTGGLIGRSLGNLSYTRCYAACRITVPAEITTVGAVSGSENRDDIYHDCFYDNEINPGLSGFRTGEIAGAEGKTTAEMQTASTYESAGWDFEDLWTICEGTNYPRFQQQVSSADFLCPDGIGLEDFSALASEWLQEGSQLTGDLAPAPDGDGRVDLLDLIVFTEFWLQGVAY